MTEEEDLKMVVNGSLLEKKKFKKRSEGDCGKWIIVSYFNSHAAFPLTEEEDMKMVVNGNLLKKKFQEKK